MTPKYACRPASPGIETAQSDVNISCCTYDRDHHLWRDYFAADTCRLLLIRTETYYAIYPMRHTNQKPFCK